MGSLREEGFSMSQGGKAGLQWSHNALSKKLFGSVRDL